MVRFKHTTDALTGGSSGFQFLCGAIQTPKPRYVVNPLICFNSYMVRFKLGQITLSLSPIGFQFLYGAIQTSSNFLLECCHLGVSIPIWCDSNYTNDYSNVNFSRFQFHMVRFKPSSFSSTMGTLFMFQFLYGAIQTLFMWRYHYKIFSFNSFMVRFKQKQGYPRTWLRECFNFCMLRLKPLINCTTQLGYVVLFLNGANSNLIHRRCRYNNYKVSIPIWCDSNLDLRWMTIDDFAFQFLYGAIQAMSVHGGAAISPQFQFLHGAIQTPHYLVVQPRRSGFNSFMVRFKQNKIPPK